MRLQTLILVGIAVASGCTDPASSTVGPLEPPSTGTAFADGADQEGARYTLQVLPRLEGETYSMAVGVNSSGMAVGYSDLLWKVDPPEWPPMICHPGGAVVYSNGKAFSLHPQMALAIAPRSFMGCSVGSDVSDINEKGEVVGTAYDGSEEETEQGFFWSQGTGLILHNEIGMTFLTGINNKSEVVGYNYYESAWGGRSVFVWSPLASGAAVVWPLFGRDAYAWDISDSGDIAGCINNRVYSTVVGFIHNGEQCSEPQTLAYSMYIRPTPGSLNSAGLVVYTTYRNGVKVPVSWGSSTSLGLPVGWTPGAASAISDRGRIVGWRSSPTAPKSVAMTASREGRLTILPGILPGGASEAYGVNACGDIAGASFGADGSPHAVLWKISRCDMP